MSVLTRLSRSTAPAPVRIVHIGLGAFSRAHQAWYTSRAHDAAEWGIAGFTGRSATVADDLAPQGGLFTLVERAADGDRFEVLEAVSEVHDGADLARLVELIAAPATALVTLTVTESGYRLDASGAPRLDAPVVVADLAGNEPQSALGRLVRGLAARRDGGAGQLAVVPCDNIPDNGAWVRAGVLAFAAAVDASLPEWIEQNVSFVSTTVDRITPRTTEEDIADVASATGTFDASPVVTEPFSDWVLSGSFPAGRPAWEDAGARFVDDVEPFERRKLWLLNGAHSLLAYAGLGRGLRTVAEAVGDPVCHTAMTAWWDEAVRHLPDGLDLDAYRTALTERFENARIEHRLEQIAGEGVTKLRVRIVPTARAERAAGRSASAAAFVLGSWAALVLRGVRLVDAEGEAVSAAADVRGLVALLDATLASDEEFVAEVARVARQAD